MGRCYYDEEWGDANDVPPYDDELWRDMPYIGEELWADLPQSFKLYCKKICNENNYKMGSEPNTTTTLQGCSADQAETVPTVTTVKSTAITINSLRWLSVIHEWVEEKTIDTTTKGALVDSGASGGMVGSDMQILNYHAQDRAHVTGIAENSLLDLPIVTGAALIVTTHGLVIGIFHQYVYVRTMVRVIRPILYHS